MHIKSFILGKIAINEKNGSVIYIIANRIRRIVYQPWPAQITQTTPSSEYRRPKSVIINTAISVFHLCLNLLCPCGQKSPFQCLLSAYIEEDVILALTLWSTPKQYIKDYAP